MSIEFEKHHTAGHLFADANMRCDFCGATSETQSACGAGASDAAISAAKAHAKVSQGWTETTVPVRIPVRTASRWTPI